MARASPLQADVVGRLLFDLNSEFATPGPGAEEFGGRFARLLGFVNVEPGAGYRMLCYGRQL